MKPTKLAPECALVAILSKSRFVSEKITTPEDPPNKESRARVRTETATTFEVGIPEDGTRDSFQVRVQLRITLTLEDTEPKGAEVCSYESKFVAIFDVLPQTVVDWSNVPDHVLKPYLSVCHARVRQRAEETLSAAGFKGHELPVPDELTAARAEIKAAA